MELTNLDLKIWRGDAAGGDSSGFVWADYEPAVAIRPRAARKAQRNMEQLLCCRIGRQIAKGSPQDALPKNARAEN